MSTKKKSKKTEKKVVFDDLSNNPYAVPCLPLGLHDEIYRVLVTEAGPLVQLTDRKVYHLDRDEGEPISVFDYSKNLREGWCHLVGIKPKHLPQYAALRQFPAQRVHLYLPISGISCGWLPLHPHLLRCNAFCDRGAVLSVDNLRHLQHLRLQLLHHL